jgi:SAM-dependent methyltransferase
LSSDYRDIFFSFLYDGWRDAQLRADFVLNQTPQTNKIGKIIDVGAGTGDLAFKLAERGIEVDCFETSTNLVSIIFDRFKNRKDLTHLISIFPINFIEAKLMSKYQLAIASNVFSHLKPAEKLEIITKVFDTLESGGKFIFNSVQYLAKRPEQPWGEIHKKVYGRNVIRHFASSKRKDGSNQEVRFGYSLEYDSVELFSISQVQEIYFDEKNLMLENLYLVGFSHIEVFDGWNANTYNPDSPGFLIVAEK